MKFRLLLLTIVLLCFGGMSLAFTTYDDIGLSPGDGGGGPGIDPRITAAYSVVALPVSASLTDNTINSKFTGNAGVAAVEIKDEYGILFYKTNIDTSISRKLSTDISMLPPGKYTIVYKSASGKAICHGKFEKK